jgi:hypothetical protein
MTFASQDGGRSVFVTHEETQTRRFSAYDDFGRLHMIVAKRDAVFSFGRAPAYGAWRYQTEDGIIVEPGNARGVYLLNDGAVVLRTSDPREPQE